MPDRFSVSSWEVNEDELREQLIDSFWDYIYDKDEYGIEDDAQQACDYWVEDEIEIRREGLFHEK